MKKPIAMIAIFFATVNLQAQKIYLSGKYNDGFIQYLNNGKYQEVPLNLNDFTYDNNTDIVIFGEFQKDEEGKSYFNIIREDQNVQLVSKKKKKVKYKCPATPDEGEITLSNGRKTYFSSFVPLSSQGNISVTSADWGVKVCDNKTYSMYYIKGINNGAANNQQNTNPSNPVNPNSGGSAAEGVPNGNTGSLLSAKEAKDALDFHNQARAEVGVEPLTWSAEISSYAQEWANYLATQNNCQLKHRSQAENPKKYGENIALRPPQSGSALESSKAWYSEISKFQNVVLNSSNWYAAGHYSQMIWRNTKKLGIGAAKCKNGYYIVVGNYDPPGNYMGQKAY